LACCAKKNLATLDSADGRERNRPRKKFQRSESKKKTCKKIVEIAEKAPTYPEAVVRKEPETFSCNV
jgi:hypothetical protein